MRLTRITKSFGATRAVDDVSLEIAGGEVLAVIGENGAGKTTLMRIAAGEVRPDAGEVLRFPQEDVGFVHQHFLLVPELTIAENLALLHPRFRFATTRRTLEREAAETIAASGIELRDPSRRVADLSVGEKSKLELIKAIAKKPSTLILDEPTSVLTPHESEELFRVMRALAAAGTAIVFISHKLPEVLAAAQRVVVMRGGRMVLETRSASARSLALAMTPQQQSPLPAGGERARVRGPLALEHGPLHLHHNEILAIVGVAGNGQSQLAEALRARLPPRRPHPRGPHPRRRRRPDDHRREPRPPGRPRRHPRHRPLLRPRHRPETARRRALRRQPAESHPRPRAGPAPRGHRRREPTRGLDLEATRFVHDRLRDAANAGAAILLITSDLDEAFALADAMQVIYRGNLSGRMSPAEAASRVATLMAGVA